MMGILVVKRLITVSYGHLKEKRNFSELTNQLTGFCMMGTLVVKWLITASYDHLREKRNFSELT